MERRKKARFWKNQRIANATYLHNLHTEPDHLDTDQASIYHIDPPKKFTPYQQYDIFQSIESKSSQLFPHQQTILTTMPSVFQNRSVLIKPPSSSKRNRLSPQANKIINSIRDIKSNQNFVVKMFDMSHCFSTQNFVPKMRSTSALNKTRKGEILREMKEKTRNCSSVMEPKVRNMGFPNRKIKVKPRGKQREGKIIKIVGHGESPEEGRTTFEYFSESLSKFLKTSSLKPDLKKKTENGKIPSSAFIKTQQKIRTKAILFRGL